MEELGIPPVHMSCGKQTNNYGYRLAELCRNLAVLVANGRCGKDRCIGKTTCNDKSLVDYVVCPPELLCNISEFEVLQFCDSLSDKHNAIY